MCHFVSGLGLSGYYLFDHHFGELLAMAVFTTIAFATFLLEHDHFVTFYEGKDHLSVYFCAFHGRHSDFNVAVGIYEKHFVECHFLTFLYFIAEMMDIKVFSFFYLELLSFDFNNCVHLFVLQIVIYSVGRLRAFSVECFF